MTRPILLVEDDSNDVFFMKLAMEKAGIANSLLVVRDGKEAMAFLRGIGKYADRDEFPLPCLILLDLRLPHMSGFEVLKWLRERSEFQMLVVIVLTSSNQDCDVEAAYRLGANAYLVKPANPGELFEKVKAIKDFWLGAGLLPPEYADVEPSLQRSFRFEMVIRE
jgi:DNA-binding response OmpR family regulator